MSEPRYIKVEGIEVPVTEEVYRSYKRSVWNENKRTRYRLDVERSFECYENDDFQFPADDPLVEDIVTDKIMLETLLEALKTLSDDERSLIDNIFSNGKTERELASDLGISNIAVHKRKNAILAKLKKILD